MSFTFCLWIRRGKQESMGTSKVEGELVVSRVRNSDALQEVMLFQKCEMLMWVSFFYFIKTSSFHSSSCFFFLYICWDSLSKWQEFDVRFVILVDAGQESLHQKGQNAALHCDVHLKNKLTHARWGHSECFRWLHCKQVKMNIQLT